MNKYLKIILTIIGIIAIIFIGAAIIVFFGMQK